MQRLFYFPPGKHGLIVFWTNEKISTHRRSHIGTHQRCPNHVGLLSFAGQILQSARNFKPHKRRSHLCGFVHCRGVYDLAWQSHSILSYNQNNPEIVLNKKCHSGTLGWYTPRNNWCGRNWKTLKYFIWGPFNHQHDLNFKKKT